MNATLSVILKTLSVVGVLAWAPLAWSAQASTEEMPTSDEALATLMEGNRRFVRGEMKLLNLSVEGRAQLAQGQSPYAVVVACADSRVSPELVFDARLGDLFVIRVAGNVVDDFELASIEYAVAKLSTPLVMVLGHENCGAVGAAVASETQGVSFGGHIHDLVEAIRPAVRQAMTHASGDDLLDAAVRENVVDVVDQLSHSKPYIGEYASQGKIKLIGARYDLDTGEVTLIETDATHSP